MAEKFSKEKFLRFSDKKIREIESIVNQSSSFLGKITFPQNLLTAAFSLNLLNLFLAIIVRKRLPEKIPFFYSRSWGNEQLARSDFIFFLPGISFLFFFLNYLLIKFFKKKEEGFLATTFGFFTFLFSFMAIIAVVKVIVLIV